MSGVYAPNAFILGVAKCGTTSLARYLGSHPDVFLPETKEPNHYLLRTRPHNAVGPEPDETVRFMLHRFSVPDRRAFSDLYSQGSGLQIRLDASVRYLYFPEAVEQVAADQPEARHIVVLRDPVARALSHWRMNSEYHLEPLGFADAVAAEDARFADGWGWDWHYRRVGTYTPQLETLFRYVRREQVLVVLFGDFVRDPRRTLDRCFAHLGVHNDIDVDMSASYRVPVEPRWTRLHRSLAHPTKLRGALRRLPGGGAVRDRIQTLNSRSVTPVDEDFVEELRRAWSPDLESLSDLLCIDMASLAERIGSGVFR